MNKMITATVITLGLFSINTFAAPIKTQAEAVKAVQQSVQKNKLTQLRPDCISYVMAGEDKSQFMIDVREIHNKKCGGDPNFSPRLFSFLIAKKDGSLKTDAWRNGIEWDGEFHSIK